MTTREYTLTVEDITAYLATRSDEDVIGEQSSMDCLGANTLKHKYKKPFFIPWGNPYFHLVGCGDSVSIMPEVRALLNKFDVVARLKGDGVSKAEWMTAQGVFCTAG
jgi:hypothetical protein